MTSPLFVYGWRIYAHTIAVCTVFRLTENFCEWIRIILFAVHIRINIYLSMCDCAFISLFIRENKKPENRSTKLVLAYRNRLSLSGFCFIVFLLFTHSSFTSSYRCFCQGNCAPSSEFKSNRSKHDEHSRNLIKLACRSKTSNIDMNEYVSAIAHGVYFELTEHVLRYKYNKMHSKNIFKYICLRRFFFPLLIIWFDFCCYRWHSIYARQCMRYALGNLPIPKHVKVNGNKWDAIVNDLKSVSMGSIVFYHQF